MNGYITSLYIVKEIGEKRCEEARKQANAELLSKLCKASKSRRVSRKPGYLFRKYLRFVRHRHKTIAELGNIRLLDSHR